MAPGPLDAPPGSGGDALHCPWVCFLAAAGGSSWHHFTGTEYEHVLTTRGAASSHNSHLMKASCYGFCEQPALIKRDEVDLPRSFEPVCSVFVSVPGVPKQPVCSGDGFRRGDNSRTAPRAPWDVQSNMQAQDAPGRDTNADQELKGMSNPCRSRADRSGRPTVRTLGGWGSCRLVPRQPCSTRTSPMASRLRRSLR